MIMYVMTRYNIFDCEILRIMEQVFAWPNVRLGTYYKMLCIRIITSQCYEDLHKRNYNVVCVHSYVHMNLK